MLRQPGIYKPFIIGVSLMAFQQLTGVNAVMFYAETIFEEAKFKVKGPLPGLPRPAPTEMELPPRAQGPATQHRPGEGGTQLSADRPDLPGLHLPQDSSLASVVVGVIQVLFTAVAALIMDRAGRRLLLVLSGEGSPLSSLPAMGWRAFAQATTLQEEDREHL